MAVAIPNYGLLTTTLGANAQVKVNLLADPKLDMISYQPGSGVTASLGWEGTDAAASEPTNHLNGPATDVPIPRSGSTGVRAPSVYLWSLAGGSVNIVQYSSNPS